MSHPPLSKSPLTTEDLEVFVTEDGSSTIRRKDSGLLYRSAHGADQESNAVFVEGTHLHLHNDTWKVFELGFGRGCNFENTLSRAVRNGVVLHYVAVDHAPIPSTFVQNPITKTLLEKVRQSHQTETIEFSNGTLTLHPHPFQQVTIDMQFHAIFHDPFGPKFNPVCWTKECFTKEYSLLQHNGVWSSYGAAGHIRRALASAGFFVAIGDGIGKKRETTRAAKTPEALARYRIKYHPTTYNI